MSSKLSIIDQIFTHKDLDLPESKKLGSRACRDFLDYGKKNLTVVFGDSWTYGLKLSDEAKSQDPNQFRICNGFGYRVAKHLDSDYLNISVPAINNLWMAKKFVALSKILPQLGYDSVQAIFVFTEYGREFHTDIDFDPEFNNLYSQCHTAESVAQIISDYIISLIINNSHNINILVTTNYVTSLYHSLNQLDRSWLEVLTNRYLEDPCLVVGSWVIPKYENLVKYNSKVDQLVLKQELETWVDRAEQRLKIIYNTGFNHQIGYGHPNSQGHRLFADYINQNLDRSRKNPVDNKVIMSKSKQQKEVDH